METDYLMPQSHFLPMNGHIAVIESVSKVTLANPMYFSALAFAGANFRGPKGGVGIFTAQEIAGLDLRGTELVVLSACETGLGTAKHGREFSGLRRALALAGAATQVTSLWRVDDAATRALMRHYYRLLLEGCARAEALQVAQERIARDPVHPDWEHPAFWAAFISAGACGPLGRGLKRHAYAGGTSI
jgi:CHAT domain-containing protein